MEATKPAGGPTVGAVRRSEALEVHTFADRAAMGAAAAADIAAELRARLAVQAGVRAVFASAPSQAETLAALAAAPGIDWSRITAFHMDEYIGLPEAAPERFAAWLQAHFASRVPLAAFHPLRPDPDAAAEAVRYAALLAEAPLDVVVLGIGVNGHLAFNDPPVADFDDPADVKIVELDPLCRRQQVDEGCFPTLDAVPRQAVTLTIPRLLRAGRMFCVVPGPMKRPAVAAMLHGHVDTACPASILRRQAHCTLYLDREADPDA